MFKNKRIYQKQEILKGEKKEPSRRTSKTKLAKKLGISRPTLNKLLSTVHEKDFAQFKRTVANNRIDDKKRKGLFNNTIDFLDSINTNRKESVFLPTFRVLKPYIDSESEISMRTYQEIIKENNFYLPSCHRKTKREINKRIKIAKNPSQAVEIIEKFEDIKVKRFYKKKMYPFGDTVEIDACVHPWFNDEKVHIYRAVDAGSGYILVEGVEKEETSMGYIVLLRKLFKKYGKPRLIVTDKRKTFGNGTENKSQVSLILNNLDIEIITSSDPTAKPNVERSFKDSQQWLPLKLFEKNVNSIAQFNNELSKLTNEHNKFFNKTKTTDDSFMPITYKEMDKELNLGMYRKVTNGNTVSIYGQHYIPVKDNKRIIFRDNEKIKILENEKIGLHVLGRGIKVKLEVISDKYVIDHNSREGDRIEFEKRKQRSVIKTIDNRMLKLEKKELEVLRLIELLKKEKEQLNAL